MNMQRYAGFDADEDAIDLPAHLLSNKGTVKTRKRLNVQRAIELRRAGLSYREIGHLIAEEQDRAVDYTSLWVYQAIQKFKQTKCAFSSGMR